jgi:hypothetical protein
MLHQLKYCIMSKAMQSWTDARQNSMFFNFQAWRQALVTVRFRDRQNAAADALAACDYQE